MAVNYVDPRSIRPTTDRLTGEALKAIKDAVDGIQPGATVGASWGVNLSDIPEALISPQEAETASIRALGTGATQAAAGNHDHAIVADEDSGLGAASTLQEAFIALSARIKALEDATP